MAFSKAEVRAAALAKRSAIAGEDRAAFAERLAAIGPRLIVDFAPPNVGLVVSLFAAIGSEPDLTPLAAALNAAGVVTALPVTGGRDDGLVFRRWAPGDPTRPGRMGIAEPGPEAPVVEPDVLFVPLAAFDRRGHRVGYGGGHYDRTLAVLRGRKAIRAIGIGYAAQEILYVPDEDHDQPLDLVVTDRETLLCGD
jgi:5-formyltetrahydrofolate cyclo-ligase